MVHDGSDGSQYDIVAPWDQDRLILNLETELALAGRAIIEADRLAHRAAAGRINEDIRKLHGIDLLNG